MYTASFEGYTHVLSERRTMTKKHLLAIVGAILALWVTFIIANLIGLRLRMANLHQLLVFIIFHWGILVLHITLAYFIWCDAKKRNELLFDIPAWTWGLMGLVTGIIGIFIYWLANCCKAIKSQTIKRIETQEPTESPDKVDTAPTMS